MLFLKVSLDVNDSEQAADSAVINGRESASLSLS